MECTIVTKDELHVPQVIHDMECIFVDFLKIMKMNSNTKKMMSN
jgi:hypothetical protein